MLLLIGIDGATPELIERLTSTGEMPVLRSLMRHGVYGRLESSVNHDPCSAWSSVLTGVNPGKHGVWSLRNMVPESYQWRMANSRMLRAPTLPQLLTEFGQQAGTLFVPMTFPARDAEWTTVSGWLAPSVEAEGFAHPESVASLARRRLKNVQQDLRLGSYVASGRYADAIGLAIEAVRARTELALDLLDHARWDFLAVNFSELDRAMRWCWHLIDRKHGDFREDLYTAHAKLISALHHELDAQIGRLVAALEPDDHLIVMSAHGTGINSRAQLCLPEWLAHLDLLSYRSSAGGFWRSIRNGFDAGINATFRFLGRILPGPLAGMIPEPWEAAAAEESDSWIDYERSFLIPTAGGDLYLNHEDSFPAGTVSNGNSDRLMLDVMAKLQSAIDPATGARPLEWVKPRERVCSGPFVNRLPHIVTRWDQTRMVMGLTATGGDGRVKVARPPAGRVPSGSPSPLGIFIAAGGGLQRGARIEGAKVEDVAATALYLRGERVPSYFDGAVLKQAMTESMLQHVPVRILQRDLPRVLESPERIEAASEAVASHLWALEHEL